MYTLLCCDELIKNRIYNFHFISAGYIRKAIGFYGFIEVSMLMDYIGIYDGRMLKIHELLYCYGEVVSCLSLHDTGSEYFIPLRSLKDELCNILIVRLG